jgi:hypothetical protein
MSRYCVGICATGGQGYCRNEETRGGMNKRVNSGQRGIKKMEKEKRRGRRNKENK